MTYQLLNNLAAEYDARTRAIDEVWWKDIRGTKALYQPYEWDEPQWIDIKFEVCPLCEGQGKHVNPSIDAHGLTREDFDEDPDFEESYWRGDYDIPCNLCRGEKVVPVPLDPAILAEIEQRVNEAWQYRQEQLAEIAAGC